MRTLILTAVGFVLAWAALRAAPVSFRTVVAVLFTLAWLGFSAWNLNTGLSHGYTLAEELPIHLVLFGVPVATAWVIWWHSRRVAPGPSSPDTQ